MLPNVTCKHVQEPLCCIYHSCHLWQSSCRARTAPNQQPQPFTAAPVSLPSAPKLHDSVCSLSLQGTILPGVTRKSVLELARDLGFTAEEAPITIEDAMQADEVFTTGTAVVLSPVGSLTYKGTKKVFGKPGAGGEQLVWARGKLLSCG